VIQSQPSASRPRNSRPPVVTRRQAAVRRSAASRPELADGGRWKVQLELAPAEIAFVYRRGLARGAEVCKRGTHEWRPLVTTPELHDALAQRASLAEMIEVAPPPGSALTLSQTLAISDPSLAALFLARRSQQVSKSAPPPPPPAVSKSTPPPPLPPPLVSKSAPPPPLPAIEVPPPVVAERAPLVRNDSASDWEDTPLLPLRITPLLPPRIATLSGERVGAVLHARPVELSIVAAIAVVLTLAITALTLRAEAPELNELYSTSSRTARAPAPRAARPSELRAAAPSTIPVVFWHDLPVEGGRAEPGISSSARTSSAQSLVRPAAAPAAAASSGPNRVALARALGAAAAAARNCGDGPVSAQVMVTFAPSGVARNLHFTAPPPVALRSCVLNALARVRLAPFQGEPVTVSKTLRW
jgi:hypothetical protein